MDPFRGLFEGLEIAGLQVLCIGVGIVLGIVAVVVLVIWGC